VETPIITKINTITGLIGISGFLFFGIMGASISKSQITSTKLQIISNDPNSKFQTIDRQEFVLNGNITGKQRFPLSGYNRVDCLVIEIWNLRFICNLVLVI
jgi:hypothetical protein